MKTLNEFLNEQLQDPELKKEYENIQSELDERFFNTRSKKRTPISESSFFYAGAFHFVASISNLPFGVLIGYFVAPHPLQEYPFGTVSVHACESTTHLLS